MEYTGESHHKIKIDAQTGAAAFSSLDSGAPLLPIMRESGVCSIDDGCIKEGSRSNVIDSLCSRADRPW